MRVSHIQNSFSAGEIGDSLKGRTDVAQYANACDTVENLLVRPYGSLISTPGTEFINECKHSASGTDSTVRLLPFVFNRNDAYIIEMGDQYFRFYTNGGVVCSTGTTPWELVHEFVASELNDIQFAQLNDVIYLTHPDHNPQKLTRLSSVSWTISTLAFTGGPFLDDNTDTTLKITASATTGTVNLTVTPTTGSVFVVSTGTSYGHWNTYFKIGGIRTNATTGLEEQGYVRITSVTSPTTATATVINTLTTSAATDEWAKPAWCDETGYPSCVTFHERRLGMARTDEEPQSIWLSKTYEYENFLTGVEDDDALNIKLASNEANEIKWLASGKSLIAGTYGGEFVIGSGDTAEALTPSNVIANKETSWGSEPIVPKKIGNFFYYIQRFGKKLRELFYYWDLDTYKSVDKTILSPHISGDGFLDIAYQQNPETILWCVKTDGTIATLTREVDQEVQGWARQVTDGLYESLAVIPSQTNPYDEVWAVVNRTITNSVGTTAVKRYVERFASIEPPTRQDECWYVHSGLKYNAFDETDTVSTASNITLSANCKTTGATSLCTIVTTSTTKFTAASVGKRVRAINSSGTILGELEITGYTSATIVIGEVKYAFSTTTYSPGLWGLSVVSLSGLQHLERETLVVLADGGLDKPNKVVSNGTITLANDYFVVIAGLPYNQTLYTLPIELETNAGSAQGKIQRIYQIGIKVNRSHKGFKVGGTEDELDTVSYIESTTTTKIYTGTIPNADFILKRISFRDPATSMGTPEILYTGMIPNITLSDDYRYGSQVMIRNEDPLPIEILSITSELETSEK